MHVKYVSNPVTTQLQKVSVIILNYLKMFYFNYSIFLHKPFTCTTVAPSAKRAYLPEEKVMDLSIEIKKHGHQTYTGLLCP